MGVTGLLPCLKEIQEPCHLERYRGKTLAVDTYGWLHRGLVACAQDLCQGVGTRKYINYVMKRVDMLCYFGVEPYLVFDGAYLPTKADTAKDRREKREEARTKADAFLKKGDRKSAWKEFMKAAGVTPAMAKSIMVELDARKIKYVVAPYEADPQMVYLEKIGLVDGILSEDSDLLIFGCKRLITKLNDSGECIEIDRANFHKVKQLPYLSKYTPEQLRLVAMLSGCDYTKGVANIGLKTAFNIVRKFDNLDKILVALRADGKKVEPGFKDEVYQANLAFQFQKVFDPSRQCLTMLNEYPDDMELDLETLEFYCGKTFENHIHIKICNGRIHPNTHEVLVGREQDLNLLRSKSMNVSLSQTKAMPALRAKSAVVPAKGAIDSFFKTSLKTKKNGTTISQEVNRTMSLKTSENKTSLNVRKTTVLKVLALENQPTPQALLESDFSSDSSTQKRSFIGRLEKQSPQQKLSPISKKIKKYVSPITLKPGEKLSKFFIPSIPTPETSKSPNVCSFASRDSDDVPESSPIQRKTFNTDNILSGIKDTGQEMPLDNLTDNDEIEDSSPAKQCISQRQESEDGSDDEIEESPVKPERTQQFAMLRQKFLMSQNNSLMKEGLRQTFGNPKGLVAGNNEHKLARDLSILEPENKLLTREDSLIDGYASSESFEESPLPEPETLKKRAHIDLRKFAFTRS